MYKQLCSQSCSTHLRQYMYTRKNSTCTRDAVQYLYCTQHSPPLLHHLPYDKQAGLRQGGWWEGGQCRILWGEKCQHRSEPRHNIFIPNIPPQGRFERIASNRSSTCSRLASPRLICICITPFNGSSQCEFSDQVRSSQCEFSDQV